MSWVDYLPVSIRTRDFPARTRTVLECGCPIQYRYPEMRFVVYRNFGLFRGLFVFVKRGDCYYSGGYSGGDFAHTIGGWTCLGRAASKVRWRGADPIDAFWNTSASRFGRWDPGSATSQYAWPWIQPLVNDAVILGFTVGPVVACATIAYVAIHQIYQLMS